MTPNALRTLKAAGFALISLLPFASIGAAVSASGQMPTGVCTTPHPQATQACAEVLAQGGNAFDAAVAASAMLAVAEPFDSGLGGGGFFLLRQAATGREVFLDGRERAPLAATRDMFMQDGKLSEDSRFGVRSAAIPHQVALISHTAERYGSLPLTHLLAPAIAAAEHGVVVDVRLAEVIRQMLPRMGASLKAIFAPNGKPLAEGEVFRQPALATSIRRWAAHGGQEFSTGETAQRMLAAVQAQGGIWQAEDLAQIAVIERAPLVGYFRDTRVVTAPPPSAGGATILQALTQLEAKGYQGWQSKDGKHLVIEALRRAFWDRARYVGDPDYADIPIQHLLSRSHLLQLASSIGAAATPSAQLSGSSRAEPAQNTAHFNVLDAVGNRVAATQSINLYFGSGVLLADTGIILNDTMDDFAADVVGSNAYGLAGSEANSIAGGRRPVSSMSPTFADGPMGSLLVGTPGGSRIPSMVLIALLQFIEGKDAATIAATPRLHHQWQPDVVQFEPAALDEATQQALIARGHRLKQTSAVYGNLSAIVVRHHVGAVSASADPRRIGSAEVVEQR
jgi:gamma-glutamyltranspeptidase/glutathione hydrolase